MFGPKLRCRWATMPTFPLPELKKPMFPRPLNSFDVSLPELRGSRTDLAVALREPMPILCCVSEKFANPILQLCRCWRSPGCRRRSFEADAVIAHKPMSNIPVLALLADACVTDIMLPKLALPRFAKPML